LAFIKSKLQNIAVFKVALNGPPSLTVLGPGLDFIFFCYIQSQELLAATIFPDLTEAGARANKGKKEKSK